MQAILLRWKLVSTWSIIWANVQFWDNLVVIEQNLVEADHLLVDGNVFMLKNEVLQLPNRKNLRFTLLSLVDGKEKVAVLND
jgi:hypothetical protein